MYLEKVLPSCRGVPPVPRVCRGVASRLAALTRCSLLPKHPRPLCGLCVPPEKEKAAAFCLVDPNSSRDTAVYYISRRYRSSGLLLAHVLSTQAHLKSQIEVFITTVFLRVLESENSTFEHKKQVLDVVTAFSDTPQALVEIFLTYDCDLHAIDLYNRIVNALSKVSFVCRVPLGTRLGWVSVSFLWRGRKSSLVCVGYLLHTLLLCTFCRERL